MAKEKNYKVRYVNRVNGDASEYERWGGVDTAEAIASHVGTEIDWLGGRAQVSGMFIDDNQVTFFVRAPAVR
jgi:hypothetical protein